MPFEPAYIRAAKSGALDEAIGKALERLADCDICPRMCRVDRLAGDTGICRTGKHAAVASFSAHFGEESPLVGKYGSGTIFFARCSLLCIFCQNYDISHEGAGREVTPDELAAIMLSLQGAGCHNINFVTPSHVVPQILAALPGAIEGGLSVPLVYNTSGYDRVETLAILDGIVDIYMPDYKFTRLETAGRYCCAPDYPETVRAALAEMHCQVGDLLIGDDGIARKGLLVRHLAMPGGLDETREAMAFLANDISPDTYVNVMPQYRPCGRASEFPELSRPLSPDAFAEALDAARKAGIKRLDRPRRVFALW